MDLGARAYVLREDLALLVGRAVCMRRDEPRGRTVVGVDGFEVSVADAELAGQHSWATTVRVARQLRESIGLGV